MMNHATSKISISRAALLAAVLATVGGLGLVHAQSQAQTPSQTPSTSATAPGQLLSLGEIETRLSSQGIKIKEIEVRDKVLEIEGYDSQGREIELVVDRRTAEILSQRFDD